MRRWRSISTRKEPPPGAALRSWRIWLVAAAAMYLIPRRAARRSALRGLVSLLAARTLSNFAGPLSRRADETAAGAFVTGAGLESLPAGGLFGLVALRAQSRDSADPFARLCAGAFGASIALASARIWPVPPTLGPAAPKVQLPSHVEPNEDGAGLSIVVNADSGDGESPTEKLREAFPGASIVEVEVSRGDEIRKALDEAVSSGALALGVTGGDGTINVAAQVALEAEKALVVVPAGTFNHFSGALGIETVDEAIDAIRLGEAVGVDVATIAGEVFLNTASFGSYVELVDAREKLEHRFGKWPAVVLALLKVLRSGEPVDVEIDGQRKKVWMAFIGNCRYHPSGFAPSWRERLDDELLDFRYVSGDEPLARTRLVLAVLTGRLGRSRIYQQTCVKRLELRSLQGPLRLARDGETFEGNDVIVIEKLEKRLAVYVPHVKKP